MLHLLYARFWHKVLHDLGHVSTPEPFGRLFNQGYILAAAFTDERGVYVPAAEVEERDGAFYYRGQVVRREYGKMGKSLKNAVTPDEMFKEYGCDTLRLYEMYMGPLDTSRPWATKDLVGAQRFLQRAWRLVVDEATGGTSVTDAPLSDDDLKALHRTVDGVTGDYAGLRDNTAVAKLIEYVNYLTKAYGTSPARRVPRAVELLVLMLGPVAPHIAEELWSRLGNDESLAHGPWPVADENWLVDDTVELPVQVNGKVRSHVSVAADASREDIEAIALADEKVAAYTAEGTVAKVIVVPGKMVITSWGGGPGGVGPRASAGPTLPRAAAAHVPPHDREGRRSHISLHAGCAGPRTPRGRAWSPSKCRGLRPCPGAGGGAGAWLSWVCRTDLLYREGGRSMLTSRP